MALLKALALLRKLLNSCQQWTNCTLPLLLKLFSVFGQYLGLCQHSGSADSTKKEAKHSRGNNGPTSECSNSVNTKDLSVSTSDSCAVTLTCSKIPSMTITPLAPHAHYDLTPVESPALFPRPSTESLFGENTIMGDGIQAVPGGFTSKPFKTIAPSERPRSRSIAIKSNEKPWVFEPLATIDMHRNQDVSQWKHYIHPEGPPYYLMEKSGGQRFSYLTEANLQDRSIKDEIEAFVYTVERHAVNFDRVQDIPENVEVVLEIEEKTWSYYMVDLEQRCVFWLHKYDIGTALGEDFGFESLGKGFGVESLDHFRNQLDYEFWQHIEDFPNHHKLHANIFNEVKGILNHWIIDTKTSSDSVTPYDADDFALLVTSVEHLQSIYNSGSCVYAIGGVARLMSIIYYVRHINFYGFNGARISIWQSVRGEILEERSIIIKCLSPLLFYAPEMHLSELENLQVDGMIRVREWKKYQSKLERDLESFVLTATVLLNANVALLSTPIVLSDSGDARLWTSPAAIASQLSIIASIASTIIGLFLMRQTRAVKIYDTVNYLSSRNDGQFGLETMAIQYSLPYALLIWSVVTFLTSIAITCFYRVDGIPGIAIQMVYGTSWLFTIPLILWTTLTIWETNNRTHLSKSLSNLWRKWKHAFCTRNKGQGKRYNMQQSGDAEANPATEMQGLTATDGDREQLVQPAEPQQTPRKRFWRVRVKNFGPMRRLTGP